MSEQSGEMQISTVPTVNRMSENENGRKGLSRRTFLKGAGLLIASGIFGSSSGPSLPEQKEALTQLDNTVFIDFAPEEFTHGIVQQDYPSNNRTIRELLGDKYLSNPQLLKEFKGEFVANHLPEALTEFLSLPRNIQEAILTKYPAYALVNGAIDVFAGHSQLVVDAHKSVLKKEGYATKPLVLPLQDVIAGGTVTEIEDKLGNKGIEIFVPADPAIKQLENVDQTIINLSFQLGHIRMFHMRKKNREVLNEEKRIRLIHQDNTIAFRGLDGLLYEVDRSLYYLRIDTPDKKPVFINKKTNTIAEIPLTGYTDEEANARSTARQHDKIRLSTTIKSEETSELRFEGAYSGDKGADSMHELFKLASAYPEKLFIAAAGNYGDDIREFRSELSAEWPNNILLCGQWNSQKNAPEIMTGNVHGADIYVDYQEQGFKQEGSSFSTAAISAYASILAQKGHDTPTIKEKLLESCESIPYYVPPTIPNDQLTQEIFNKSFNQIIMGEAPVFKLEAFREPY